MKIPLAVTALLITAAATPAPLAGNWAGDRMSLHASPEAIVVQSDCASGKFDGAVVPDAKGRFATTGYFNEHKGGMQLADVAPADRPVAFSGTLRGDTMLLTITAKGKAQHYTLVRNQRIKFVRCL